MQIYPVRFRCIDIKRRFINKLSLYFNTTKPSLNKTKTNSTVYIYTVTVSFCILCQWYGDVYDLNVTVEKPSKIAGFS